MEGKLQTARSIERIRMSSPIDVIGIHLNKVHSANKDYIGWKVSQASVKKEADGELTLASAGATDYPPKASLTVC